MKIPNLETIPDLTLYLILDNLSADDVAVLHVTCEKLFFHCSGYIRHKKAKNRWEETIKKLPENKTEKQNLFQKETDASNGYWDCWTVQTKRQFPVHFCICLDINKLDNSEIYKIIDQHQNQMQYLLFQWNTAKKGFFPIIGMRLRYHHLQRIYKRPRLNYKLICKAYRDVERYTLSWKTRSTSALTRSHPESVFCV